MIIIIIVKEGVNEFELNASGLLSVCAYAYAWLYILMDFISWSWITVKVKINTIFHGFF